MLHGTLNAYELLEYFMVNYVYYSMMDGVHLFLRKSSSEMRREIGKSQLVSFPQREPLFFTCQQ